MKMKMISVNLIIDSKPVIIERTIGDYINIFIDGVKFIHCPLSEFGLSERYVAAERSLSFISRRSPSWLELNRLNVLINELCWRD